MATEQKGAWMPETPGGTVLVELRAPTEDKAWRNLMREAAHMPYRTKEEFQARGYKVLWWEQKQ